MPGERVANMLFLRVIAALRFVTGGANEQQLTNGDKNGPLSRGGVWSWFPPSEHFDD